MSVTAALSVGFPNWRQMWPWAHLALGYALFSLYSRSRYGRPPTSDGVLVLAFATQVPDLLDKPLAYWFGVFPTGRALFHSLLVLGPLLLVLWWVARDRQSLTPAAFGIGYTSHLLGDSWQMLLGLRLSEASLLWPIIPSPSYETNSFGEHLAELTATLSISDPVATLLGHPVFYGELLFTILVIGLWIVEGQPGLRQTVALVTRVPQRD